MYPKLLMSSYTACALYHIHVRFHTVRGKGGDISHPTLVAHLLYFRLNLFRFQLQVVYHVKKIRPVFVREGKYETHCFPYYLGPLRLLLWCQKALIKCLPLKYSLYNICTKIHFYKRDIQRRKYPYDCFVVSSIR